MPVRREIRTLQLRQPRYFDDRLWPTNLALVVMGSVLAGAAIYDGHFSDPIPWRNGVVRLLAVGLATGFSLWAVNRAGTPRSTRYKLCVSLSLLLHTALAVLLNYQYLQITNDLSEPTVTTPLEQQQPTEEPVALVVEAPVAEQLQPEFDKPVESGSPQAQVEQLSQDHADSPALQSTTDVTIAESPLQPQAIHQDLAEAAVARRAEQAGLRSRRLAVAPSVVDTTAEAPSASAPIASQGKQQRADVVTPLARSAMQMPSIELATAELASPELNQPTSLPQERIRPTPLESSPPRTASRTRTSPLVTSLAATVESPELVPVSEVASAQESAPKQPSLQPDSASSSLARATNVVNPTTVDDTAEVASSSLSPRLPERVQSRSLPSGVSQSQRGSKRRQVELAAAPTSTASVPASAAQIASIKSPSPNAQPSSGSLVNSSTSSLAKTDGVPNGPVVDVTGTSIGPSGSVGAPSVAPRRQSNSGNGTASGSAPSRGRRRAQPAQLAGTIPAGGGISIADVSTSSDTSSNAGNASESTPRATVGSTPLARATGLAPVIIDAAEGPGGMGLVAATGIGLPDRRARLDSGLVHSSPARLIRKRPGSMPTISGTARVPAAAFAQRGLRQDESLRGGAGAPTAKTEAAIELGLVYLSLQQLDDGRWSFAEAERNANPQAVQTSMLQANAGATGLALLSFLGAGYDHYDDQYARHVDRGLQYLKSIQSDEGLLFPEGSGGNAAASSVTRFYSHGIATLALCEALGMTGDPELREPAQRALNYIMQTQHPDHGGWRYIPGLNSDLSVTGWQVMALRSGELAGLEVNQATYRRVAQLVEACRERGVSQSRYCYNPWASASDPRTRHGRQPSTVMTAVGLLAQLYLGSNREHPLMQQGSDHLLANLPQIGDSRKPARTGTLGNPLRDTYYWYYATQVMFHMGGRHWEQWNENLHPLLVESQTPAGRLAGSWHPMHPVPDKWAPYAGRLYVTTLNLLSLEVYYRHLPLYEMTAE